MNVECFSIGVKVSVVFSKLAIGFSSDESCFEDASCKFLERYLNTSFYIPSWFTSLSPCTKSVSSSSRSVKCHCIISKFAMYQFTAKRFRVIIFNTVYVFSLGGPCVFCGVYVQVPYFCCDKPPSFTSKAISDNYISTPRSGFLKRTIEKPLSFGSSKITKCASLIFSSDHQSSKIIFFDFLIL